MADLTGKLWPAFLAEVGEHLESLELALVGRPARSIGDVNAIFRSFHTIKGGCAMMGFHGMEAVAHAGEDILDTVRRGQHTLTDEIVSLLLEATDCLKAQLAEAGQTRSAPAPAPELLARLRAARESDGPAAVDPLAAAALGFADQARRQLPALAVSAFTPGPLPARMRTGAVRLAAAARDSGLPAVGTLLERLAAGADVPARMDHLAGILDRLAFVEEGTGADCGTRDTATACRAEVAPRFRDQLAAIAGAAEATLSAGDVSARRAAAGQAALACLPAITTALLMRLRATASLLRFIAHAWRECARGGVAPAPRLLEMLAVAASVPRDLDDEPVEDEAYLAAGAQMREHVRAAAIDTLQGEHAAEQITRVRQHLDIHPEMLETLDARALSALEGAIVGGGQIVEIEADLESTPDYGQEFIAWLTGHGTLINNQTLMRRESGAGGVVESSRLRFLVLLHTGLEEARLALGDMDPQRKFYDLRPCPPTAGSAEITAPEGPAADAASRTATASATGTAAGGGAPAAEKSGPAGSTLRVDSQALDRFVDRVGEMISLRNTLSHLLARDDMALRLRQAAAVASGDLRALLTDVEARLEQISQIDTRMLGALGRMQEDVLALRVVPVGMVFNRLPRAVRDLSHAQGKSVALDLQGEDVRIDKGLVDLLVEPLMHLVRNAVDHGIESAEARTRAGKPAMATITLSARQQGNTLLITLADDGAGLDLPRIRSKAVATGLIRSSDAAAIGERELAHLIFLPGFSTAEQVTAVSGRGVGMDVVKTRMTQIGGQVEVDSVPGRGTTFTLKLPLSVAIQSVVHVTVAGRQLALPDRHVLEILDVDAASMQSVQGQAACLVRGMTLPVYGLAALLGIAAGEPAGNRLEIVVLSDGAHRIGLQVDRVLGRPDVFVRDIHPDLARIPGVGGASVLGDGRVVIILDCENLFDLALRRAQSLRSLLRAS